MQAPLDESLVPVVPVGDGEMPPLARAAFRRRFGRLDERERAAFVADLLSLRGYPTTAVGGSVRVTEAERPIPCGQTTPPDGSLAVPVRTEVGDEVCYLDGSELHAMVLYAVDRADADALCRRHLDCPLAYDPAPPLGVPQLASTATLALVGLVAVVVVVGGAAGWQAGPAATCETCDADRPATTAPATSSQTAAGDRSPASPPQTAPDDAGVPATHAAALAGRSYTIEITYAEARGSNVTVEWHERVRVASPEHYVTEVDRRGDPTASDVPIANRSVYVSGDERYVLGSGGSSNLPGALENSPIRRAARVIAWTFDPVRGSSVELAERNGFVVYRTYARSDGWPEVRNVTSLAFVDGEGYVVELRRRHRLRGTNVTAIVELRYRAVGNTTVERPVWATEGRPVPRNDTLGDP